MPDAIATHRLVCDASGRLLHDTATTLTLMLPWPVIQAYRRALPYGRWFTCRPDFAIPPEPGSGTEEDEALRVVNQFCARIPARVRRVVAGFPERHWDVLAWAGSAGLPAEDLLASNPALAFAIACADDLMGGPRDVRRIQKQYLLPLRKQAEILGWLGFPATERARKVLKKIRPHAVTMRRLVHLRHWLADARTAEALARLPVIDHSVMAMVERGSIAEASLTELLRITRADQQRTVDASVRMHTDAQRVWQMPDSLLAEPIPQPPHPGRPLQARMPRPNPAAGQTPLWDFPPPPVPGTDAIIPIRSVAQLIEEGRVQKNCAATLAPQLRAGQLAIYRVLYPERCTLSLKRHGGGWEVDQLEAANNTPALPVTACAIAEWLAGHAAATASPARPSQLRMRHDAQPRLAGLG